MTFQMTATVRPKCTLDASHAGYRVLMDGASKQHSKEHRRIRWRCVAPDRSLHRFTVKEPVRHPVGHIDACTECDHIYTPAEGPRTVAYAYHNTPELPLREGSRPHSGGAVLTVLGEPPERINGEYWTDRDSKGTFAMDARSPVIAQSFAQAQALPLPRAAATRARPPPPGQAARSLR